MGDRFGTFSLKFRLFSEELNQMQQQEQQQEQQKQGQDWSWVCGRFEIF